MRLLLAEDDALLGEGIQAGLKMAGYVVDWVRDGDAALLALTTEEYGASVLDLGLPKKDGMSVLTSLRQRGNNLPVLILTTLSHKNISMDPSARRVTLDGQTVSLSVREYALLHDLLSHQNHIRSRSNLEQSLYGWGDEVESNAVEVHIHHLRKKFGTDLIQTIRGMGYMIGTT